MQVIGKTKAASAAVNADQFGIRRDTRRSQIHLRDQQDAIAGIVVTKTKMTTMPPMAAIKSRTTRTDHPKVRRGTRAIKPRFAD